MQNLNAKLLTSLSYGINGAGGGGNSLELHNPGRTEGGIVGLTEEIGARTLPFLDTRSMRPDATVCSVARLGRPGAKADQYASQASQAVVEGLQALADDLGKPFPTAVFPVEATAGQMARATRAALAATDVTGSPVGIVDGDVCGGLAVPAVPLAFRVHASLGEHPAIALIELAPHGDGVKPKIDIIHEPDPGVLEDELRSKAAQAEMGAVWFAWLMTEASGFDRLFTPGAITSSLKRGAVVENAVKRNLDPASELLMAGEIEGVVARGVVADARAEEAPGFAQFSYVIDTERGPLRMAARNEYIVMYDPSGRVVVRAPQVISVLDKNGPVQSHMLHEGAEVAVVSAKPQSLKNNPPDAGAWMRTWEDYWKREQKKGTWNHPY